MYNKSQVILHVHTCMGCIIYSVNVSLIILTLINYYNKTKLNRFKEIFKTTNNQQITIIIKYTNIPVR